MKPELHKNPEKDPLFWILIAFIIFLSGLGYLAIKEPDSSHNNNHYITTNDVFEPKKKSIIIIVSATVYYPNRIQCDSTPNITADMTRIDTNRINSYRIVAISKDLFKSNGGYFEYGDTIIVESDDNNISGYWIIHDRMNSRYSKKIDFMISNIYNKWDSIKIYKK